MSSKDNVGKLELITNDLHQDKKELVSIVNEVDSLLKKFDSIISDNITMIEDNRLHNPQRIKQYIDVVEVNQASLKIHNNKMLSDFINRLNVTLQSYNVLTNYYHNHYLETVADSKRYERRSILDE